MAKKLKKGEKLDQLLSELAKLREEVRELARAHAALADRLGKSAPGKSVSRKEKKPAPPAKARAQPKKSRPAPKRPVLVSPAPEAGAQPAKTATP